MLEREQLPRTRSRPLMNQAERFARQAGPAMNGLLPDVHKIAVLRANGIGDFIFSLPALESLRAAYPEAEIVYLGLSWHARFLEARPSPVDQVVTVPPSRGVSYPDDFQEDTRALTPFFAEMQAEEFDLALQMHGGGRFSNPFLLKLGARVTAGLRSEDAVPLDLWTPYSYWQPEVLRYLEVVSLVGATQTDLNPHITVTRRDLEEAERVMPDTGKPIALIHPGAGDPRRRWPVEKFAAVGNALAWEGAQVAIIGAENDITLDEKVQAAMSVEALNLGGKLSLSGLVGLFSRASVLISNDSGPLHLASAVGTPTVGVFWCGNLITAGPSTRRQHRPAISWRLNCPVCGKDCTREGCNHQVSFVEDVSQVEVTASALELLEMSRRAMSLC